MLVWVPMQPVAGALGGIDGVDIEVVNPDDGTALPPSVADVEFYVPPPFPRSPSVLALDQMPSLKLVQTLTAGIDLLRPRIRDGVRLCNARGVHDASTAEWVVAALLAVIREFGYFAVEQAAGRWATRYTGTLAGQTVLIVGYGSIGKAVEQRLAGFDATIVRVARTAREGVHPAAELPALLPHADAVILVAPVTAETTGMVNAEFLAAMREGAVLVNGARGTLVVTQDLCDALRSGRVRAALDVTDPEPLPAGHQLWTLPNVLITPHIAATTAYSALAAVGFIRDQLQRYVSGSPMANVITGEY
jgi:phosphoglycerate dehydrogenase-like enzyme